MACIVFLIIIGIFITTKNLSAYFTLDAMLKMFIPILIHNPIK